MHFSASVLIPLMILHSCFGLICQIFQLYDRRLCMCTSESNSPGWKNVKRYRDDNP